MFKHFPNFQSEVFVVFRYFHHLHDLRDVSECRIQSTRMVISQSTQYTYQILPPSFPMKTGDNYENMTRGWCLSSGIVNHEYGGDNCSGGVGGVREGVFSKIIAHFAPLTLVQ